MAASTHQIEIFILRILIPLLVVEFLLIFLFATPDNVAKIYHEETALHAYWLGQETEIEIRRRSADWTSKLLNAETARDIADATTRYAHDEGVPELAQPMVEKLSGYFKERVNTMEAVLYMVVYRYYTILEWFPPLMVFYLMVVFDGWMVRVRSMWDFSFKSPILHRTMTSMFMISIIYLFLIQPFLPGRVSPFYAPMTIILQAFSMWGWIAFTQKRL